MRPPVVEFDQLTSTLIVNAFKLKDNRLSVKNRFLRSVLYCQPGKPNLKSVYSDVSELPDGVYRRLFDKDDEDKIVNYLRSLTEKELSAREAKRNFDFWMTQAINESIRTYYQYLARYDHLKEKSTRTSKLLALENALMWFTYASRGMMDDIAPLLQRLRIRLEGVPEPFVFNKPKRKKWEKCFLAHAMDHVSSILVKPAKGKKYHVPAEIPETIKDILALFYLRTGSSYPYIYVLYEQLLINFVLDNRELDKDKIFILDSNRMDPLFNRGIENIKVNEHNLGVIRKRVEGELKLKVYLPFELICFSVYRFEFVSLYEENSCTWTFESVLVVFDHATKFVIHRAKLTGEPGDFELAVRVLIEGDLKIPILIRVDPDLSGYVDECRKLIDKLGITIEVSPCSNFRLSHFLDFFATRSDMYIKYMIAPDKARTANTYVVETPKDTSYQECLDRFLELALDEFNTYDDTGSSDSACKATASDAFRRMKKGFSKEISKCEFALLYYDRVEAVTEGKTCRAQVGNYVLDYKLDSNCNGKTTLLIDANKSESDGFVLTTSGTVIEAKYHANFMYEDAAWATDLGCAPLKILDVGDESNRLSREELGIPNPEELLAHLQKTRILRKNYNLLKTNKLYL